MITVQASGLSDVGNVRKANEDTFLIDASLDLYVVADGMGGHRGGGVASLLAVKVIAAYLSAVSSDRSDSETIEAEEPSRNAERRLHQSIRLANQKIFKRSTVDNTCRGMGTTISALYLSGNAMVTANVGDSPIYLIRDGQIKDLYTPHTLLHEGIPEALKGRYPNGRLAHILTRAVGVRPNVKVDLVATPISDGDIVVICSDGVSNKLDKTEICNIVHGKTAEAACQKLITLANQRGGEDNSTVIVAHMNKENEANETHFFQRLFRLPAWLGSLFTRKQHD